MTDTIPGEVFTHPEVELMVKSIGTPWKYEYVPKHTSISVFEIYGDNETRFENMDHKAFANYCGARNLALRVKELETKPENLTPVLRIIFVEQLYLPPPSSLAVPTDKTALLMHHHLKTPMLFFRDQAPVATFLTIGNAMFVRRDDQGELDHLDGYYQYCSEKATTLPTHTWFSHGLRGRKHLQTSNYVIHQCPKEAIKLVRECANQGNPLLLARPFAIDALLLNHMIMEVNAMVITPRASLLKIETLIFTQEKVKNVSELHRVARDVRFIKGSVGALLDTLDNLIATQKEHLSLIPKGEQLHDPDRESVRDSLALLKSKSNAIMRELSSLEGRATLKIDLEYNLENQQDSRTNLRIARLTTDIAAASQKDSYSMITMAAVTMFFLPGTFVSAFFSMQFIHPHESQWWIYPTITIPLTIVVFIVWVIWKRRRNVNKDLADFQHESEEEKALLVPKFLSNNGT